MIGKVILSHGGLATELLRAAEKIAGPLEGFVAVSLDWGLGADQARERVSAAIAAVDQGQGVLILGDMFGDTPCNAALSMVEAGKVELISGINLPLVVRLGCQKGDDRSLAEIAEWARDKAISSIRLGSQMRSAKPDPGDDECGCG